MQNPLNAIARLEQQSVDRDNKLAEQLNILNKFQAKSMQKQQIEALKEIISHTYSKSISYSNVIIIAGYVAFFSIWNFVKDKLSDTAMLYVALLGSLSAILFVLFEVYKMISGALHFRKLSKSLQQTKDPQTVITKLQEDLKNFELRQHRFWIYMLIPTLLTGLLAAAILIYCIFSTLLNT